ncbi:MAG: deoxyribodipyrimidine photo-lyase [Anaerosomatales bacterium]|nr:deoxyribodipyrimidine photo-lyase [Anaerosomatales bacterium]MDI6843430.1 deoxyribodipyrimidine photo-lyase [Anaerosomatales bacterium]
MTSIVLFTNDLRLADNPALAAAVAAGPVVPLAVDDPREHGAWPLGSAARAWRALPLASLARSFEERGAWLAYRAGDAAEHAAAIARETGARTVHVAAAVEPDRSAWQRRLREALAREGVALVAHAPNLLHEPEALLTQAGRPYTVFTPFFRALVSRVSFAEPLPMPTRIAVPAERPASMPLPEPFGAPPALLDAFTPGEAGAIAAADRFFSELVATYEDLRDVPSVQGTSRLSPHLAHGEISVRELARRTERVAHESADPRAVFGAQAFFRQLAWREFAYHLLHHFPHTPSRPLKPEFEGFWWERDERSVAAWQQGLTGYPLVDAGLRELAATGWMHNRVRMVAASLLTKDLMQPWTDGASWFWERLVDADLANNTLGWQWVAGCGADAQPFFRVFNPVTQSRRFDPDGAYVRRWVPELARVPSRWIHAPWEAPPNELVAAGARLGETYPLPLVDHAVARARAIEAFRAFRSSR